MYISGIPFILIHQFAGYLRVFKISFSVILVVIKITVNYHSVKFGQ